MVIIKEEDVNYEEHPVEELKEEVNSSDYEDTLSTLGCN